MAIITRDRNSLRTPITWPDYVHTDAGRSRIYTCVQTVPCYSIFTNSISTHVLKPKIFQIEQRNKFKRKAFQFPVLRSEMLGLQAAQKSNGQALRFHRSL